MAVPCQACSLSMALGRTLPAPRLLTRSMRVSDPRVRAKHQNKEIAVTEMGPNLVAMPTPPTPSKTAVPPIAPGIHPYSMTSSARASSVGGRSRPSALTVFRLITSSYLVGACTGRSAGLSPLRMRST